MADRCSELSDSTLRYKTVESYRMARADAAVTCA